MDMETTQIESIIERDLPIVDAHHHLWFQPESALIAMESEQSHYARAFAPIFRLHARYLLDEYLADLKSGHNIRASVFTDSATMHRTSGPDVLRPVGQTEFVNGVAAMGESGLFGETKVCSGIVGNVDLRLGDGVEPVLTAHIEAGGSRFRGVRNFSMYDQDPQILGPNLSAPPLLLLDPAFRRGFRRLSEFNLSFDALVFEPQLPEVIDLAQAFPDTHIVLNHVGVPVGVGRYGGKREERFPIWRDSIRALARCANVSVKLGGLGIPFGGFPSYMSPTPFTSAQLAREWSPYIETSIEAFGADRCMFESNFPVDSAVGSYAVVWNAFKRLTTGASAREKTALFSGTAIRVYPLAV